MAEQDEREGLAAEIAGYLAMHRAVVSGDVDGWHVICQCGFRGRGADATGHVADALTDLLAARDRQVRGEALREAAGTLDDLALTLMTTSDDNPTGNSLTASIVTKCAEIVRQGADA